MASGPAWGCRAPTMTAVTGYWEPRTEADLQAAIGQCLLKESHTFDDTRTALH